jgi:hypothetical protein
MPYQNRDKIFTIKKIALLTVIICFSYAVKAQDYYHAIGAKYNFGVFTKEYTIHGYSDSYSSAAMVPGVFYKAMLAFDIDRNSLFALAAYPFFGLSGVIGTRGSSDNAGIAFELPVVGEYMIGDPEDYHFYANVGLSFLAIAGREGSGVIFGPRIGVGGQFEVQDRFYGVKAALLYGINSDSNYDPDWVVTKQSRYGISFGIYMAL